MGLETCKMSEGPWAALCVGKMSRERVTVLTSFKFWGISVLKSSGDETFVQFCY